MTFQHLQLQFSIPKEHFSGFLQIRHFGNSRHLPPPDPVMYDDVERFLVDRKGITHYISTFYALQYSNSTGVITSIAQIWEKDLDAEYIEDDWQEAIKVSRSTISCNRLRETQNTASSTYNSLHTKQDGLSDLTSMY